LSSLSVGSLAGVSSVFVAVPLGVGCASARSALALPRLLLLRPFMDRFKSAWGVGKGGVSRPGMLPLWY